MSARVILLEPVDDRFDISDLSNHGDVVYLFGAHERVPHPFKYDEFVESVFTRLRMIDYDPAVDCIALVGKTAKFTYLAMIIAATYGCIRVLLFDAVAETYNLQEIEARKLCHIVKNC